MESYTVKPPYEDQVTKEPTEKIQVHLSTAFSVFFLIGDPYFCPSICTSFNSGTLQPSQSRGMNWTLISKCEPANTLIVMRHGRTSVS